MNEKSCLNSTYCRVRRNIFSANISINVYFLQSVTVSFCGIFNKQTYFCCKKYENERFRPFLTAADSNAVFPVECSAIANEIAKKYQVSYSQTVLAVFLAT